MVSAIDFKWNWWWLITWFATLLLWAGKKMHGRFLWQGQRLSNRMNFSPFAPVLKPQKFESIAWSQQNLKWPSSRHPGRCFGCPVRGCALSPYKFFSHPINKSKTLDLITHHINHTHIHQTHNNQTHQFWFFVLKLSIDIPRFHLWLGSCDVTTTTGGWHLDIRNALMRRWSSQLPRWLVSVSKFMSGKLN